MGVSVQHNGQWVEFTSVSAAKAFMATKTMPGAPARDAKPVSRASAGFIPSGGWSDEDNGVCNRCAGSGVFKSYGGCFRCDSTGKAPSATWSRELQAEINRIKAAFARGFVGVAAKASATFEVEEVVLDVASYESDYDAADASDAVGDWDGHDGDNEGDYVSLGPHGWAF